MKRRIFQTSFTAPSHMPTGLHEPQDISKAKRGKFVDWENAHPPSCRADADADASSIHIAGTQDTRCDDPKTSEYAYFKKLKKDASQNFRPLLKEDDQLKKFKSINGSRETKNMVKDSSKDLKSSFHIKEFTPINFNSFLSPHGCASKNSGTQCIYEEAFSRKRQKLRQWVDTSFPEINVLCSKGYDFISALLSRLSPKTCENKSSEGQKMQPVEIDMKSKSLAFSESYICSNKLQYCPIQNLRGLESGPYLNDGSSFCQIDKSKEKLLWKWDLGSDPPTCPPSKFHLQYQKEKPDCDLDGESSACLWTENDSTSGFSFEKYGLVVSSHLKELDEFRVQKELMLRREAHSLLLDWDFDNMKGDEISKIASPNMELNMDSTLPISLADDYWQSRDNRFDASGLYPSSLLSYTSLTHSYSDSYCNYDHGQHSLEERKCLVAKLQHFPLTLSYCPNLTEDCTYDNTCKDGSIVCSPQDHHWSMSMFFNENQHPGLEALLLSSGFDFDFRQKHLLLTDYPGEHHSSAYQALQFPQKEGICSHFVEDEFTSWLDNSNHKETLGHFPGDILNIRDWSSINLLMSLNKEKACPLLLDKSSWSASEAEMDIDDCEGKHT